MPTSASFATAQRTLCARQKVLLGLLMVACCLLITFDWFGYLVVTVGVCTVAYALVTMVKLTWLGRLLRSRAVQSATATAEEHDLPTYTILVPLYREANVVGNLVAALRALDYPPARLQILLLVEADDRGTHDALRRQELASPFEILVVSDGPPKTKPKACNEGLSRAVGELLVIYDAEDRPEPDQLRKAVSAFRASPDRRIACHQATLVMDNATENLLTRLFQLEYAFWYRLMLPALTRWEAPVPLGGSSNHFRTDALTQLGGWDAYNVTEDCDLGIRLARAGYRVAMLDSTTYEEAPTRVGPWLRQRSRWQKGYLQTYLVHTRSPIRFVRETGFGQFLCFSILIGATPVLSLLNPVFWAMFLWHALSGSDSVESLFPGVVGVVGLFNLIAGNLVFIYALALAAIMSTQRNLIASAILAPIGWGLISVAAWIALWELVRRPHYWQKTTHGVGKRNETVP